MKQNYIAPILPAVGTYSDDVALLNTKLVVSRLQDRSVSTVLKLLYLKAV